MNSVAKKSGKSKGTAKRAEQPISGIRRAAEHAGIVESPPLTPEQQALQAEHQRFEEWSTKREALNSTPLTLTLAEACELVGRDLAPCDFQTQVFDVLARELNTLSDIGENASGFEGWCAFQNLRSRIALAGKIAAVIGGWS